jgi:uncharacterized protein (DUF1330 family)
MKAKLILTAIAGIAVGAAGVHGLHAQGKPKAYIVTENEIIDQDAYKTFVTEISALQKQYGGTNLRTSGGKVIAFVGEPPKSVGITEFDSLDQAVAFRKSEGFTKLDDLRNKSVKLHRQYAVEVRN